LGKEIVKTECLGCAETFDGIVMDCEKCGGVPVLRLSDMEWDISSNRPNIWRYASMLPKFKRYVTLGEGLTPIRKYRKYKLKLELRNPTGSYADRASAVLSSYFLSKDPNAPVRIKYASDFTYSLVSYLIGVPEVEVVLDDPFSVEVEEILSLIELGATVNFSDASAQLSYMNPLTIEGLKTTVFELFERGIKRGKIFVPAETGILAISIWKGIEDLRAIGEDAGFEVVAVHLEGMKVPSSLDRVSGIDIFEVSRDKALKKLIELAKAGIKTKLLSAASLEAMEEDGEEGSIAIITASDSRRRTLPVGKNSRLSKEILRLLSEGGGGTAYEIWERMGKYTLRGVYKTLASMESAGLVASSFSVEGRRKKKVYFLPNEDMKKGSSNS